MLLSLRSVIESSASSGRHWGPINVTASKNKQRGASPPSGNPVAVLPANVLPVPVSSLDDRPGMAPFLRTVLFKLAAALAGVWFLFLVALWLFAGPVAVVSRPQIEQSAFVITGRVTSLERDQVEIVRVWSGELEPGTLTLLNLQQVPDLQQGDERIFPLARFGRDHRITLLERQGPPPLVYPVTPEITDQLKRILRELPPAK